ncbi:MAG: cysteine-rich KTR domain-containing protein [Erysipelotrichaceae bacterium]|nr:cysteine-rich KTR domain-containing protein [Erysipelotrichaceae bacterium]
MEKAKEEERWVLCPSCGSKTRVKIRKDTVIEKFPLFCPKCKKEFLINIREFELEVITEKKEGEIAESQDI